MLDRIALQVVEVVFALAIYFLPAIIADHRKRQDILVLALFNALMGWTIVGWLMALYWAHLPNPPAHLARDVTAKRKLLRMTAFSTGLMARVNQRAAKHREAHR
ncbi:superinfection immunity protein [Trinickia dinghuensis]|uniref:Superinfection immunity protein n=1 Tax=Trinickia dinghuensis TaxID=2291023 RepID=A0A3D8K242_9BURK|nr:superinfection immunity protein [Trinickia dinghuensis]RDU98641.1 superinfection immunity protein [Trinickia dinghuensis]